MSCVGYDSPYFKIKWPMAMPFCVCVCVCVLPVAAIFTCPRCNIKATSSKCVRVLVCESVVAEDQIDTKFISVTKPTANWTGKQTFCIHGSDVCFCQRCRHHYCSRIVFDVESCLPCNSRKFVCVVSFSSFALLIVSKWSPFFIFIFKFYFGTRAILTDLYVRIKMDWFKYALHLDDVCW